LDICPFCHTEISEDLLRFGGTCPTCLAQIPGEEAPTDPGDAARAEQEAADHRAVRKARWVVEGLVGVALLGLLGFAGWTVFRPKPVAKVLDFDDVAYQMDDTQFVAYVGPEPEPAPKAAPVHHPKKRTVRDLKVSVPTSDDVDIGSAVAVPSDKDATPETAGTRGPSDDAVAVADVDGIDAGPTGTQTGGIPFGIDIGVRRRQTKGIRLTDDDAIVEMIKDVLLSGLPRLKSCYESSLKTHENLQGRWTLSLVVGREGNPKDIRVKGDGVSAPQMEHCIATKVAKWAFQPIRADQPVQKSLSFKPGF